jgi:hypothetical protein
MDEAGGAPERRGEMPYRSGHRQALVARASRRYPLCAWRPARLRRVTHDRRRVLHFNLTEHPSAAWTAQQIVDAFPEDSAPS